MPSCDAGTTLTCWFEDLGYEALFLRLPLDGCFVSFNLSQDITRGHRVTLALAPRSYVALCVDAAQQLHVNSGGASIN